MAGASAKEWAGAWVLGRALPWEMASPLGQQLALERASRWGQASLLGQPLVLERASRWVPGSWPALRLEWGLECPSGLEWGSASAQLWRLALV